jgi:two-component system response regulator DesR
VKDSPVAELARAIRAVVAGERVIDRDLAGRLFLSEGTVRNYLSSAIGKTGARTRVEAARVAEDKGWL